MNLKNTPYKYYLTLPQPETESILEQHLIDLGCKIDRGVGLVKSDLLSKGVAVSLHDKSGKIENLQYDYVVGCDGSRSTVRDCLGINFLGYDYNMRFLLFDALLDWAGPKEETHYYVKEDGFIIIIPLVGGRHRVVIKEKICDSIRNNVKKTKMEYQSIINYFGPPDIRIKEIYWESNAPFYNRLAEKFCDGNVFLAGDAAHLFSPIGGLGMNTGIQDAYNLAWKMAGVIYGKYQNKFLESYEFERRFIARTLVQETDKSTLLITREDKKVDGNIQNWLPKMVNRKFMREVWPLSFSGLGQHYCSAEDHQIHHPSVGMHVPFAIGLDKRNVKVSSYELLNGYLPIILLFWNSSILRIELLLKLVEKYGCKLIHVVSNRAAIDSTVNVDYISDDFNQFRTAYRAVPGEIICLRPDGYIGHRSHVKRGELLKQYLESFML